MNAYTLITGASSGIGRGIAIALSMQGRLILSGRNRQALNEVREACHKPEAHLIWECDLADVASIEESFRTCMGAAFGFISDFIHSAGVVHILPMRSMNPDKVMEIFSVNTLSAIELVRLLLKRKINPQRPRSLIFVSSTSSLVGEKGGNAYCGSKGAIDSFMRSLAVELAPETRVNSVLPGIVATQMGSNWLDNPNYIEMVKSRVPLGAGEVEDVVNAVEYLMSSKAKWVTGQQFVIDGGRTIT